jgi:AcrR family transcriptional regulator
MPYNQEVFMGIKERQTRERGGVRRSILNAARALFLAQGYANVSMRKIAEQIEYSPGAIYSYFRSKDDIFFALAEEGLRYLQQHCSRIERQLAPLESVRESMWRLYTFSKEQPEYFWLIFVDNAVPRISREWERFSFIRDLRQAIEHQIQLCIDAGTFPRADSSAAIFRVLSTAVYGAAVFRLSNRLGPAEDADSLAHDLLEATIAGLRSGMTMRFEATNDTRAPLFATSGGELGAS